MQFRDLKAQYQTLKTEIDAGMANVLASGQFLLGKQVTELEQKLAQDVNRPYCVSCANGTDALVLAIYKSAAEHRPVQLPLQDCATTDFEGRFGK